MASDFYPPFIGGAERQVALLSRHLTLRGHEVNVATVWHTGLPEQQDDSGVGVYRLKGLTTRVPWFSKDPKRRFHPPFPDPGIVWGLRQLLVHLQPDVLHAAGWIAYSCAAALLGKRVPLLISVRDYGYSCAVRTLLRHGQICDGPAPIKCLECATRSYGATKALAAVVGIFGGRLLLARKIDAGHTISTFVQTIVRRDLLRNRENTREASALPPTMVIPSFREDTNDTISYESFLNLLPVEPYILFVGGLQAHKGLGTLLAAYERLISPPSLILIGTVWPDTPRQFPPGVIVLRSMPHHSVMAAWERCLFGVAPSLWPEPFGGVVLEAMSKRKAIIATNMGGPIDIITHGKTGLLVPPGDVDALAGAMRQLIGDAELRERLGRAAGERAKLFTADVVVPRFEELYRQLIGGPREIDR